MSAKLGPECNDVHINVTVTIEIVSLPMLDSICPLTSFGSTVLRAHMFGEFMFVITIQVG